MNTMLLLASVAALSIDNGRQLFVDDWLVAGTTGVVRVWNAPTKFGEAPLLKPETAVEKMKGANGETLAPCAVATSGGLWWDPTIGKFRLWYEGGWMNQMCYAESADGLAWTRPDLRIVPGTNRLFAEGTVDSFTVFPDYAAANPYASWKLLISVEGNWTDDFLYEAADGIHFNKILKAGRCGDRTTMYYDTLRGSWVFSLRDYRAVVGRCRAFWESKEFGGTGCRWSWRDNSYRGDPPDLRGLPVPEPWLEMTTNDLVKGELAKTQKCQQLYSFDAIPYESVMLGVWEVHNGPENDICIRQGMPKITDLHFSFSRDGKDYGRPHAEPAIAASRWGSGKWDTGYLSAIGGICVIRDERLWFYYTAFRGDGTRGTEEKENGMGSPFYRKCGMHFNGAIGAATLRRDGFVGIVADGAGEIVTKPVVFSGSHLFVNAEAIFGSVAAEICDEMGAAIPGFAAADCVAFAEGDSTKTELTWKDAEVKSLAGQPVTIRFKMKTATLYSFWVSKSARGESNGWLAAGGPAYRGLQDK